MDIEIENKLLEVIREIRAWDPEEDSAETLLTVPLQKIWLFYKTSEKHHNSDIYMP